MSQDIKKAMWKAMANSPIMMVSLQNNRERSEPMHAQLDKDADNCFWFFTKKNNRIAPGGKAIIHFEAKGHELFACLTGTLSEEQDKNKLDAYWSKQVEAWYEDGKDDDQLLMMRFDLNEAEIWNVDPDVTGLIKLASGATLDADEMGQTRKVHF